MNRYVNRTEPPCLTFIGRAMNISRPDTSSDLSTMNFIFIIKNSFFSTFGSCYTTRYLSVRDECGLCDFDNVNTLIALAQENPSDLLVICWCFASGFLPPKVRVVYVSE